MQDQHLAGGQPALEAEQLGQVADLPPGLPVPGRRAQHHGLAAGRPGQAEQQLDRRGLARPVRAEEPEDLAALDGHRQPGERDRVAGSACSAPWRGWPGTPAPAARRRGDPCRGGRRPRTRPQPIWRATSRMSRESRRPPTRVHDAVAALPDHPGGHPRGRGDAVPPARRRSSAAAPTSRTGPAPARAPGLPSSRIPGPGRTAGPAGRAGRPPAGRRSPRSRTPPAAA